MEGFRWGIFGTGAISAKFICGLAASRGARVSFIASRSLAKAQRLAAAFQVPNAIEGYAQAARAAASEVDAVYIATPPSEHAAHALMCIEAGVPVLVEKPFASSAEQARRIAAAARARSVFAMEALWTRFLPAAQALREMSMSGAVGEPRFVTGSFGTSQRPDARNGMFSPALGGGALAHLAPYPLSLAQWLFGTPRQIQASGRIGASGVDEDAAFQLLYPQGVIGSFYVSLRAWAPDDFRISGSEGSLALRGSIVRPTGLDLVHESPRPPEEPGLGRRARWRQSGLVHRLAQQLDRSSRGRGERRRIPYAGNGYHYEAEAVRDGVARGLIECPDMPLDDSIAVAETIDLIRAAISQRDSSASLLSP